MIYQKVHIKYLKILAGLSVFLVYEKDILTLIKAVKKGILLPENPTNGDMIKALFPNAKTWEVTRDDVHCVYIEFKNICEIKSFPLSWWNAPYKADSSGD